MNPFKCHCVFFYTCLDFYRVSFIMMGQGELHRTTWQPLKYLVTVKSKSQKEGTVPGRYFREEGPLW